MEQNIVIAKRQQDIILRFGQNEFLTENFYFTGGTALSEVYLQHRYSEDLDFFSIDKFDDKKVTDIVGSWAIDVNARYEVVNVGYVYMFNLIFSDSSKLKIDFAWYPYKNIGQFTKVNNVNVDSTKDIACNKFVAVGQRADVKDFVDLYFLLNNFSVVDLYEWPDVKFRRKYDLMLFASDLLKVAEFDYLPKMIKPLSLDELKKFYLDLAKNLGMKVTDR